MKMQLRKTQLPLRRLLSLSSIRLTNSTLTYQNVSQVASAGQSVQIINSALNNVKHDKVTKCAAASLASAERFERNSMHALMASCCWSNTRELQATERMLLDRYFEYTPFGTEFYTDTGSRKDWFEFSMATYNVLAQNLLQDNAYLYPHCSDQFLAWEYRSGNLLRELSLLQPDILCLQEVMEIHFETFFFPQLNKLGYDGHYKKKTRALLDGCATFYKRSKFSCIEALPVEYFDPEVSVLDRDNVGLLVLLRPNQSADLSTASRPEGRDAVPNAVCVANTHLLFNPRRGDVKLAQVMKLFAEIDRLAHLPVTGPQDLGTPRYHPIIVCGDFNTPPFSDLYDFMLIGRVELRDLVMQTICSRKNDDRRSSGQLLSDGFLSRRAGITDRCQLLNVCNERVRACERVNGGTVGWHTEDLRTLFTQGSGVVCNHLCLASVFQHVVTPSHSSKTSKPQKEYDSDDKSRCEESEATTCHRNASETVDYILYAACESRAAMQRAVECGDVSVQRLRLLARLSLPSMTALRQTGGLPNQLLSSDHILLIAKFALNLKYISNSSSTNRQVFIEQQ